MLSRRTEAVFNDEVGMDIIRVYVIFRIGVHEICCILFRAVGTFFRIIWRRLRMGKTSPLPGRSFLVRWITSQSVSTLWLGRHGKTHYEGSNVPKKPMAGPCTYVHVTLSVTSTLPNLEVERWSSASGPTSNVVFSHRRAKN